MSSNLISAISLFAGAGGLDVGFEHAGVTIKAANELNNDACNTYETNHPNTKLFKGNLLDYLDIIAKYRDIDMVIGGPPCQGFSVAGKMDPSDERSKMIWYFLDVVNLLRPKVFVMENVKALASLAKWKDVKDLYLKKATSLGYTCHYFILNASDFGVPQNRERVFFVGSKKEYTSTAFTDNLKQFQTKTPSLREILTQLPPCGSTGNPNTCTAKITLAEFPIMRKSPYAGMLFNGMGRPLNLDLVSNTLPASMGGNKTPIIDEKVLYDKNAIDWVKEYHCKLLNKEITPKYQLAPSNLRRITIQEAALIQTFPKNYIFKGSKSAIYTQIGNAVPCKLAECIAKCIIKTCL
ncbi:MAG: DNA cytosine methyltransferase [Alphaproteobacteria bacterium]|nr:DNA cytosine methyltransferase [Alphaproteobacteria bacterium]